jgi:hypothetical protein
VINPIGLAQVLGDPRLSYLWITYAIAVMHALCVVLTLWYPPDAVAVQVAGLLLLQGIYMLGLIGAKVRSTRQKYTPRWRWQWDGTGDGMERDRMLPDSGATIFEDGFRIPSATSLFTKVSWFRVLSGGVVSIACFVLVMLASFLGHGLNGLIYLLR